MSIHRSLRTGGGLSKHRNVLTRNERIKRLEEEGRWVLNRNSVWGLPKVKNIKAAAKKKEKKADAAVAVPGAAAGPGAAPAPAASAAKPAAKK